MHVYFSMWLSATGVQCRGGRKMVWGGREKLAVYWELTSNPLGNKRYFNCWTISPIPCPCPFMKILFWDRILQRFSGCPKIWILLPQPRSSGFAGASTPALPGILRGLQVPRLACPATWLQGVAGRALILTAWLLILGLSLRFPLGLSITVSQSHLLLLLSLSLPQSDKDWVFISHIINLCFSVAAV